MKSNKNFGLIGAAGYIAPRHMEAMHQIGANLVCALDRMTQLELSIVIFPKQSFLQNLRDLTDILIN